MISISVKNLTRLEACIGLIGKKNPEALVFNTHFGIHTFFLRFSIDVIILNSKNTVITLKKGLKPNNIFVWNPFYNKVIELPEKTIENKKIKIGQKINLIISNR